MSMINREVAWRVFANEFNESTLEIKGAEERAPSYLVTPLGAKINRLYAVGVLTEKENIGDPKEPMWRARVTDQTGTFFVSAGQYQPEVTSTLTNMEPPIFVAVIGKASTYEPDDETFLTSIRAELIKEVSEEQRDNWIIEAARSLKKRLEVAFEASKMDEVSVEELVELGFDENLAEGYKLASEHYDSIDFNRYERMLEDSLRYVLPEYESKSLEDIGEETEEGRDEDLEDFILEVIADFEERENLENGVDYERVKEKVMEEKEITQEDFEESVTSLRNDGKLYEPVLGNLKRID
ncbi:MAG: RPA family protein [Candidatus Natronoplasma sp.]